MPYPRWIKLESLGQGPGDLCLKGAVMTQYVASLRMGHTIGSQMECAKSPSEGQLVCDTLRFQIWKFWFSRSGDIGPVFSRKLLLVKVVYETALEELLLKQPQLGKNLRNLVHPHFCAAICVSPSTYSSTTLQDPMSSIETSWIPLPIILIWLWSLSSRSAYW